MGAGDFSDVYNDPAGIWDEDESRIGASQLQPRSPFLFPSGDVNNPAKPIGAGAYGSPASQGDPNPISQLDTARSRVTDLLGQYPAGPAKPVSKWEMLAAGLAGGALSYSEAMRLYGRGDPMAGFRLVQNIYSRPQEELEQQRRDWATRVGVAEKDYNFQSQDADRQAQEKERQANTDFRNRQLQHMDWEEKGGPQTAKENADWDLRNKKYDSYIKAGFAPADAAAAADGRERVTDPIMELMYETTKNPDGSRNPKAALAALTNYNLKLHEAGKKDEFMQGLTLLEKEESDNVNEIRNQMSELDAREKTLAGTNGTGRLLDENKATFAEIDNRRKLLSDQLASETELHRQLKERLMQGLGIKPKTSNSLYQNPNADDQGIPAPPGSKEGQTFRNKRTGALGIVRGGKIYSTKPNQPQTGRTPQPVPSPQ